MHPPKGIRILFDPAVDFAQGKMPFVFLYPPTELVLVAFFPMRYQDQTVAGIEILGSSVEQHGDSYFVFLNKPGTSDKPFISCSKNIVIAITDHQGRLIEAIPRIRDDRPSLWLAFNGCPRD